MTRILFKPKTCDLRARARGSSENTYAYSSRAWKHHELAKMEDRWRFSSLEIGSDLAPNSRSRQSINVETQPIGRDSNLGARLAPLLRRPTVSTASQFKSLKVQSLTSSYCRIHFTFELFCRSFWSLNDQIGHIFQVQPKKLTQNTVDCRQVVAKLTPQRSQLQVSARCSLCSDRRFGPPAAELQRCA